MVSPGAPLRSAPSPTQEGRSRRPRLLDVCAKAGGAAMGYFRAGFDVVCLDREPQPNNPFPFVRMDLRHLDQKFVRLFDVLHFSPPCQKHSDLAKRNGNADAHDCYIDECRAIGEASGLPYVIENVSGSPLRNPVTLCGTMFPGLRVLRHRDFESNMRLTAPAHGKHPLVFTHDKRKAQYGRLDQDVAFVQVTGGGNCSKANAADAMGIDWMTKDELNEAIPPVFTEFLGRQLLAQLDLAEAA